MAKNFTKFLCAFLAFVMCLGTVPAFAIGDVAEASLRDETTWPITKTANGLDENDQTDVTLTVPGVVEGAIDVVFILGGGMTANIETIESAINVFKPAMESGKAKVRMGLISLEKGKEIILDLNSDEAVLDPATYVEFVTEKFDSINDLPGGSTNLHSQILEAQKMLEKETEAKAENKFVFVLATGRTYWFDDANGNQATIVGKVTKPNGYTGTGAGTFYYYGNYHWQSLRGKNSSLYMIPDRYNNSYEDFLVDIEKWVAADGNKYEYSPMFDKDDISAYANWYNNNSKDWRDLYDRKEANGKVTYPVSGTRYGMVIINPAPTASNFISGTIAGIDYGTDPAHAMNYERAQYECIQVWKELIASGYNCYSICSEHPSYQNNSENIKSGAKYVGTSTAQLGHSFMNYLAKLAGQDEAPIVWEYKRDANGKVVFDEEYPNNYNMAKTILKQDFFDSIKDDMLYTTSIGTTVEDYIGINENGNFEFIENADYIKLVVGGEKYTTKQIETKEGANSSYAFYHPWNPAEPTFWLDYYYGDGKTTERFVWTFGEDVHMQKLASLTYKLQLTEKQEEAGTYVVPTNIEAILHPVDSDGHKHPDQYFPVPEVEYEVNPYDVDIVIALGAGIAQYTNTYDSIITLVEPLVNQGINVKLGYVAVEHYTEKAMDLTLLTKDNYKRVIQSGLDIIQNMPAGPTNLEGVIAEAHAMLAADDTVPNANKFFYVIATGRTYCFDDAEGNPATTLNSIKLKGSTYYYWGHYAWQSQRGRHTSLYLLPNGDNWDAYWKDVVAMNEADEGKYDYTMPGDYSDPDWYVGTEGFYTQNTADAKAKGLASSRYGWIINDLTGKSLEAIGSGANPGHAMAYDRGQYEAWVAYTAMQEAGINCYAICSENTRYQNNSPYIKVAGYEGKTTMQVGHSFMNFLAGSEATLLFKLTDPNTGASEMAKDFFQPIVEDDLIPTEIVTTLSLTDLDAKDTAARGHVASVSVEAEGDGLTYAWYYKSSDMSDFALSNQKGSEYKAVMDSQYDEHQVYCVITDQYGNETITDIFTLNLDK